MARVLVVDDDAVVVFALKGLLEQAGHSVEGFEAAGPALERARAAAFDVVLTDLRMPDVSGLHVIEVIDREGLAPAVVVISAHGTIESAVEAMRRGAVDFIEKPFDRVDILSALDRALRRGLPDEPAHDVLLGHSPPMREVLRWVNKAARSKARVLVRGESGTGKELVARAIHAGSERASSPFVAVNCAAIPENLLEAELFGFEAGAFTGAVRSRPGRIEIARGGTLFLDEIGDLSASAQAKLLRFLEEGTFERLGSGGTRQTADVRIVTATLRALEEMVKEGRFRDDLYYRLAVLELRMPPLRERREDVPTLARSFFADVCRRESRPELTLTEGAIAALSEWTWPGNVRELRNVVERLVVFADGAQIDRASVDAHLGSRRAPIEHGPSRQAVATARPSDEAVVSADPTLLEAARRSAVREALTRAHGNRSQAARILDVSRRTLHRWLRDDPTLGDSFSPLS